MKISSDYLISLDKIVEKLITVLPTDISDDEILNLERLLNDIYRNQLDLHESIDLESAIIEALSQASELSDRIKKNLALVRDASFFLSLKKLPRLLRVIRLYLYDQQNQLR